MEFLQVKRYKICFTVVGGCQKQLISSYGVTVDSIELLYAIAVILVQFHGIDALFWLLIGVLAKIVFISRFLRLLIIEVVLLIWIFPWWFIFWFLMLRFSALHFTVCSSYRLVKRLIRLGEKCTDFIPLLTNIWSLSIKLSEKHPLILINQIHAAFAHTSFLREYYWHENVILVQPVIYLTL